jgi:hypothetical protein
MIGLAGEERAFASAKEAHDYLYGTSIESKKGKGKAGKAIAVFERGKDEPCATFRVRRPGEGAKYTDPVVSVLIRDGEERRFIDCFWVRPSGALDFQKRYAKQWETLRDVRIVSRIWSRLRENVIPDNVELWPDEALQMKRRQRFEATHEGLWRCLLANLRHARRGNYATVLMDRLTRFGDLTALELAEIAAWEKMTEPLRFCERCGEGLKEDEPGKICRRCVRKEIEEDEGHSIDWESHD